MTIIAPDLTEPTQVFDFDAPEVTQFVRRAGCYKAPNISSAIEALHDSVRDGIDYNVFNVPLHSELSASDVASGGAGFCLHKSILFVAAARKLGVPALLCSDVVTNHVADEAMIELVGGEEFLHWFARIHINGRWINTAPIFNTLLCNIYGIDVLKFNPTGDSIAQRNGHSSSMTYLGQRRTYSNPNMADLLSTIESKHPKMVTSTGKTPTSRDLTAATTTTTGVHA